VTGETPRELRIRVDETAGEVGGLLVRPAAAEALLVLAHGAGAGMRHAFMEAASAALAARGVATLRYQFPYAEAGKRRPDPRGRLIATVRAAVACGAQHAGELALFAGGKSMGGRMTSLAASEGPLDRVRGIVFLGFPLHAAGKPPGDERAAHLVDVAAPMLFVQGSRDKLADLSLLRPVVERLGGRARLHEVEGGDHGFQVLRRSGRSDAEVMAEIGDAVKGFCSAHA
jgi:hypothetical protein